MKQTLQLRLGQQLAMTPQMRQALRLLQLSSLELEGEVQALLDSNYMLEREDEEPHDTWPQEYVRARESASGGDGDGGGRDDASRDGLPAADAGETLRDRLLWQLHDACFSGEEYLVGTAIVDAIGEDGYLEASVDDIAAALGGLGYRAAPEEVESVLLRVQRFDPPGCGARDLGECLSRQLEEMPDSTPHRELTLRIAGARGHLEAVARRDSAALRRALGATDEELDGALALLRSLHPRPGAGAAGAPTEYVRPDLLVSRSPRGWRVELNAGAIPRLRVNALYAELVRQSGAGGGAGSEGEGPSPRQQLAEAKWLVRSLSNRGETLLRVGRAVVRRQAAFLERGEAAMAPLALRDIASELDLHESTVSRVAARKYVQTPRGVFELRRLFSNRIATTDGGAASAAAVRARLRGLIEREEPGRPRSDRRLAADLESSGFRVARRTVAKYREAMGIPPSPVRRRAGAGGLRQAQGGV